ncbi:MAG: PCMD domain-containing protein [Mediterranea sp.]|nr:PCMD domain-containing protein [Mediterranea sp.]
MICAAQTKIETISFGDMNNWVDRRIKESFLIGGEVKHVYAIGPTETIEGNIPYVNKGGSPWATSNVMAHVAGIYKTNVSVFPEKRDSGYCARLDTHLEKIKVLGVIDITVLAAGSVFLGEVHEPIQSTKNPQQMLSSGIPFTKRPIAIRFDYKVKLSGCEKRIRATGFSRIKDVEGKDYPEATLFLQKRWEDADGRIYAKRIGTMVVRFTWSCDWQNKATFPILYGDITSRADYSEELMRLQDVERYAVNSKGESVPINEIGWGASDDVPTHLYLQFASSDGGAYIGSPGNSLYIDNVELVYP